MDIANKREDGVQTAEILKDMKKKEQALKADNIRKNAGRTDQRALPVQESMN